MSRGDEDLGRDVSPMVLEDYNVEVSISGRVRAGSVSFVRKRTS